MTPQLRPTSASPVLNASILMGTSLVLGGSIWAGIKERKHRADYPGFETRHFRSSTGNRLQVAIAPAKNPSAQSFVLVPGLSSSISTVAGLGTKLSALGHQVVMFNRAGYGGSVRLSEEPFHINEFIIDLYNTLTELATDNSGTSFHLVGHSLGGYLLHEFARKNLALVSAVSYLDPMHPKELQISNAQRMGSKTVELSVNTVAPFIKFGAALLYGQGVTTYSDGYQFHDRILADLASSSVWKTAKEEWKLIYPYMLDGHDIFALPSSIDTQVIAAGETVRNEPAQESLYREYSDSIHILMGAGHQSMLTKEEAQNKIAHWLTVGAKNTGFGDEK